MSVIPLDIDLDNNVGGYFSLLLLQELMKEFKCRFVKNKLSYKGEEKLFLYLVFYFQRCLLVHLLYIS